MSYKIKRAIFWSLRHLGHGEPCWDHLTKTSALVTGLWFTCCPQSLQQNSQQQDPSLSAREGEKQKHLACITNSNFCIQGLLNLTPAHECKRVAAVIQVTWQCRQANLQQGSQAYGGLLGAKRSWGGNEDETLCPREEPSLLLAEMPTRKAGFQGTV